MANSTGTSRVGKANGGKGAFSVKPVYDGKSEWKGGKKNNTEWGKKANKPLIAGGPAYSKSNPTANPKYKNVKGRSAD